MIARQSPRRPRGVDATRRRRSRSSPATSSSGTPTASSSARTSAARSTARSASAPRFAAPPSSTRWDARERRLGAPGSSSATAAQGRHHDGVRPDCVMTPSASAVGRSSLGGGGNLDGSGGRRRARAAERRRSHRLGVAGRAVARSTGARRSRPTTSPPPSEVPRGHLARLEAQRRLLATGGHPLRPEEVRAGRRAVATRARSDRHRHARAARPGALQDRRTRRRPRRSGCSRMSCSKRPDSYAAQLQLGQHLSRAIPSAPRRRSRST